MADTGEQPYAWLRNVKLRGRPTLPREHGTERGWQQHRHRGEPKCEPCIRAHRAHNKRRYDAVRPERVA